MFQMQGIDFLLIFQRYVTSLISLNFSQKPDEIPQFPSKVVENTSKSTACDGASGTLCT
jgi:hypothetical protein